VRVRLNRRFLPYRLSERGWNLLLECNDAGNLEDPLARDRSGETQARTVPPSLGRLTRQELPRWRISPAENWRGAPSLDLATRRSFPPCFAQRAN
jgi:hypothetical protein